MSVYWATWNIYTGAECLLHGIVMHGLDKRWLKTLRFLLVPVLSLKSANYFQNNWIALSQLDLNLYNWFYVRVNAHDPRPLPKKNTINVSLYKKPLDSILVVWY